MATTLAERQKCLEMLTAIRALHNFPQYGNWVILEMGLKEGVITEKEYQMIYDYLSFWFKDNVYAMEDRYGKEEWIGD